MARAADRAVRGVGAIAVAAVMAGAMGHAKGETRPDVVVLVATGWRAEAPGYGSGARPAMRAVEELAASGRRFTNAFSVSASPAFAEAALLTGLYPGTLGSPAREFPVPLPDAPRLPERFRAAGWWTVHVGAWRLGAPPSRLGYEAAAISFGSAVGGGADVSGFEGRTGHVNVEPDEWIAQQVAAVIQEDRRPLFLTVIWHGPAADMREMKALPHISPTPPPVLWDDELVGRPAYLPYGPHRERARAAGATNASGAARVAAAYRDGLAALDRRIGRVRHAWESCRGGRPVCVVVTSLHGWLAGEHGLIGAGLPYELVIRVPLVITAPGLPGGDDGRVALTVDLAPTLLSLAGFAVDEPGHGRALWPPAPDWRDGFLHELPAPRGGARAAWTWREWPFKYVRTETPGEPGSIASEELYDLAADPCETNNLAIDRRRQGEIGALAGAIRRAQCAIERDRRALNAAHRQTEPDRVIMPPR